MKPRYPGLLSSLGLVFPGWQLFTFFAVYSLRDVTGWSWNQIIPPVSVVITLTFACLCYVLQPARGATEYFRLHAIPWQAAIRIPLLCFGALFLITALKMSLVDTLRFAGVPKDALGEPAKTVDSTWMYIFVMTVFVAPFTEELIMRGLVLQGLLQCYKPTTAILLSSLIFGVSHWDLRQGIGAFLGGCFMGWVFVQTRSLWVTIIIHASHNAYVDVLRQLRLIYGNGHSEASSPVANAYPVWELGHTYGIALLLGGVSWLMVRSCYRTFQQEFFRSGPLAALRLHLSDFKAKRVPRPSG